MRQTSGRVTTNARGSRRVHRAVGALALIACMGFWRGSAERGGAEGTAATCEIASVTEEELRTADGSRIYIEPASLTPSGGDLLLAGTPNYVSHFATASSLAGEPVPNGMFGVILRRDGSFLRVPPPMDGSLISGIRTTARAARGWHVVFTEAERLNQDGFPDPAVRVWYGVLEDTTWLRLEALPLAEGHEVSPLSMSSLVARGDSLMVAAIVETPEDRKAVAAFTRRSGAWQGSVSVQNAAYVEAVWQAGREPLVAVVKGDETLGSDVNSLLLYSIGPEWSRVRRVAGGTGAPAHAPRFQAWQGGHLSGLVGRHQEMGDRNEATLWPLADTTPGLIFDTSAAHLATHVVAGNRLLAVVEHLGEDDVSRELRLYLAGAEGAERILSRPYPYAGFSASTFLAPDQIVIAGPVLVPVEGGQTVVSLLLRMKLDCTSP